MNAIKPDIALFYISSLLFVHVFTVLAELLKASRKQHDGDGNGTTLPNVESTEHLHDMETAGQLLIHSAPQSLGSEMVHVWGRVLGGAQEIYLIDAQYHCIYKFGYTPLYAYSLTESETHAQMSHLITVLVQ